VEQKSQTKFLSWLGFEPQPSCDWQSSTLTTTLMAELIFNETLTLGKPEKSYIKHFIELTIEKFTYIQS